MSVNQVLITWGLVQHLVQVWPGEVSNTQKEPLWQNSNIGTMMQGLGMKI
jgi:hypothetical protein